MAKKYTERAREALERAIEIAQSNMNTVVEPEHLLLAILEDKSIMNRVISSEEIIQIKTKLNSKIAGFGRITTSSQPQMSYPLGSVLRKAETSAIDFVSVPLLALNLLGLSRIAELFKDPNRIITAITQEMSDNKFNSLNSDDPEDKMSKFAVEIVELARQNKLDPVVGRDDEIRQIIEVLSKKTKSNAIMVGKPGVGKTAIINGIAQLIAKGECKVLEGFKIYNVDVGAMVAGASHRGDFEERLKGLVKEAESSRKVILFIDEIHIVLGAGKAEGSLDAANILKPRLADGSLKVIGATTYDEYRMYVSKDPAFERRFVKINVKEPSIEDTITILRGLRERLEAHHGVKISDKALVYAASIGKKYIPNRRLPDLAIDLIDTACSSAIINLNSEPIEIQQLRNKIWSLELEKTSIEVDLKRDPTVIDSLKTVEKRIEDVKAELNPIEDAYNQEKSYLVEAKNIRKKLEEAKNEIEKAKRENNRYKVYDLQTNVIPTYERQLEQLANVEVIMPQHVAEVLSRLSGIPMSRLTTKESEKLINMSDKIKKRIFGQNEAIDMVVNSILASKVGLSRDNKPLASFLFLGPTGVGKTELSKTICEELNDTCENMVVLDMSDYVSEMSINKLIGAPAGYVGCEEGGTLTEPIKEMPYNVVLLDEVDLAHQSNLNVLYQLLDEGRVTDGRGVKVSFRNTVIVMTSNLGQQYISSNHIDKKKIEELIIARFGQPLINRIDNIVIFNHLSEDAMCEIFKKDIEELNKKLHDKNMKFKVSEAVMGHAVMTCTNSNFGARIIKRYIKDNFINAITRIILSRKNDSPIEVSCFLNEEGVDGIEHGNYTYVIS
ncbi:uncharacterized protein VICG_00411 [Vittaforma corneae ATCC 50505]|uniref:Clp R domain-containing protein n=1 Tax=Vittaforma corneae (strain ATCC 50505) TaxID=993615 RepID=L2GPY8_VITCO|nr:uncharacterized protein VICG_00411 [Vittaforma corneae ATCC 50505]ELA42659.1 hypothetical protein VICG_00411 [Vittaforma corneae ATCC 50505]